MFQNVVSVSVNGKKDHGYPGAMVKDGGPICKKTHGPKAQGNGIKKVRSKLSLGHRAQPNNNHHSKSVHGRGKS
nr:hypothetical protein CFP56_24705 [Quercus suber]